MRQKTMLYLNFILMGVMLKLCMPLNQVYPNMFTRQKGIFMSLSKGQVDSLLSTVAPVLKHWCMENQYAHSANVIILRSLLTPTSDGLMKLEIIFTPTSQNLN